MRLRLLYTILLFSVICYSQERKYFTKFKPTEYVYGIPAYGCGWGKPTDSLKVEISILNDTLIKGLECTLFEIKYKGEKLSFWIGIHDKTVYSFKKNQLDKPVKMFDFKQNKVSRKNIYIFPFSDTAIVNEPYADVLKGDRLFSLTRDNYHSFLTMADLEFYSIEISLERGVFFEARKTTDHSLIYSNLDEI